MKDATGAWLGGAQGFTVTWSGALLIEQEGTYEFWAGAPTPGEDRPDADAAEHRQWRVVLRRGQRTWVILSHHWAGEEEHPAAALPLKRGAYELTAELIQPAPEFGDDERGPAAAHRLPGEILRAGQRRAAHRDPAQRAVRGAQGPAARPTGSTGLSPGAAAYLGGLYVSSLRDIRRTYQRAFKALLFCAPARAVGAAPAARHVRARLPARAAAAVRRRRLLPRRRRVHAARRGLRLRLPAAARRLPCPRLRHGRAHRSRRRSASRRCSTGGSGCSTTPRPARTCAGAAGARCGTCSRRRRKSSPPTPATCCATWARTPGTGSSTCATSRARTSRCTR